MESQPRRQRATGQLHRFAFDGKPFCANVSSVKLAFFINAYNAVTVKGILREYPTNSIRNHTAKLYGYNIWHDLQLYVGGTPLSLNAIGEIEVGVTMVAGG